MHLTIHVTWNRWNIFAAGWRWVFVQYKIQNANELWQYQLQNRLITTTLKEKSVGQLLFRRIYYIVYTFLPNNTWRTSNWQSVKELWRNHGLNIGFLLSCMQVRLDREAGRPRFLTDTNGKRKGKIMQINGKKEGKIRAERRKRTTAEVSLYFELPYNELALLRSRYQNATPNLCWVFCALLGILCN